MNIGMNREMVSEDWDRIKNFTEAEFKCKHCGEVHMNLQFITELQHARYLSRCPYVISSGYRCLQYDAQIGGKGNHPTGQAADILIPDSAARYAILNGLFAAGFTRIGIGKTFVHVDGLEGVKPREMVWLYD